MQTTISRRERRKLTTGQRVSKTLDWVPLQFVLVGLVAALSRLALMAYNDRGVYFSDSWDYIFTASGHIGPPSRFHSPFVYLLWKYATFGHANAATVLWLHLAVGVATTVMVFAIVRLFTEKKLAMVAALLCSLLPAQIFAERTYLTEALTSFFLVVALLGLVLISSKRRLWSNALLAAVAFGAAGCLVAVRPSLQVVGLTLFVFLAVALFRLQVAGRTRRGRLVTKLSIVSVCCLLGLVPCVKLASWYQATYDNFSIAPGQAINLFARWGSMIPCSEAATQSGTTKAAILEVCDRDFPNMPGSSTNNLWNPDSVLSQTLTSREPEFETEVALKSVVMKAMTAHPFTVLGEMARSVEWQLVGPPYVASGLYHVGSQLQHLNTSATVRNEVTRWMGPEQMPLNERVPFLGAVESTARLPQLAFGLFCGMSLVVWARLLRRRRRGEQVFRLPPGLVLYASALVLASIFTIALGGIPSFRYWTPVWPCLTVLVMARITQLVPRTRRTAVALSSPE